MSKTINFKHPLLVQKPIKSLSCPQKCKIPQNIDLPASSLIVVKSESRKFLCNLYYLSDEHDDKKRAYVDDSVEINPSRHPSHNDEIQWIHSIEHVAGPPKEFKEIDIELHLNVDDLNLDVVKEPQDLTRLTTSILKHYNFCAGCEIRCNRNGISRIFVSSTDEVGYGMISMDTRVNVTNIAVDSLSPLGRCPLGGLEDAEESLKNLIQTNIDFLEAPHEFRSKPDSQALLIGPVGTGKTSLVHRVANELNCILFELSGDVFQPLPGETEQKLEEIFSSIKTISRIVARNQIILILFENLEIFCPKLNPKMTDNSHSSRVSSFIIASLDEFAVCKVPTVVVGTTSQLEALDPAVRRSRRMGNCEMTLDMPNEAQRLEIIGILCSKIPHGDVSNELQHSIAQSTPGFVGADLEILCQFASRHIANENLEFSESNFIKAFELGLKSVIPSVMRDNLGFVTRSNLKLDAIGGMEKLKKSLVTSVLGPLRHPEKFRRLGLRSPSGILLYGPSGCAKTTIVKCLAGESKMTLISVSSADIYSAYVGEAEKFIVKLFNQARMNAPTILFLDEIDTIVGNRSAAGGGSDTHMRILSTLLTEIDGFGGGEKKTVLIMGATNKPHMIDDALMRPGRFDKLIHVPAPDCDSRVSILKFSAQQLPLADDVSITSLAQRTENFSGADLVNLCNEAAMCAATKDLRSEIITNQDFDDVLAYLGPSLSERQIQFYKDFEGSHQQT